MVPVQITFRDIPNSPAIENQVRKKAEKLSQFYHRISNCRIVIETIQKHKHQGKLYNVRIDVTVPGKELVANHKFDEDIYIAIRDSFSAIKRQLEEYGRVQNGHVKIHEGLSHGRVKRIIPHEGYGFIEGVDGNEYYFSVTNVCNSLFEHLLPGTAVEFIGHIFNDGLQAHHVKKRENHSENG